MEIFNAIVRGFEVFGPLLYRAIDAIASGRDVIAELAELRVDSIVPDPLRSELALYGGRLPAHRIAELVRTAREIHAGVVSAGAPA